MKNTVVLSRFMRLVKSVGVWAETLTHWIIR
jgi:hypothetical protein